MMRDQLLNAPRASEILDIEGIGRIVVREMCGTVRAAWAASADPEAGVQNEVETTARLVALTAHDESGQRIFGDSDIEAITTQMSWPLVERIAKVALRVNGLGRQDAEELRKN